MKKLIIALAALGLTLGVASNAQAKYFQGVGIDDDTHACNWVNTTLEQDLYWYDRLYLTNLASFQDSLDYHSTRRMESSIRGYAYCWLKEAIDSNKPPHKDEYRISYELEFFADSFNREPEEAADYVLSWLGYLPRIFYTGSDREVQTAAYSLSYTWDNIAIPQSMSYILYNDSSFSYTPQEFIEPWENADTSTRQTIYSLWTSSKPRRATA